MKNNYYIQIEESRAENRPYMKDQINCLCSYCNTPFKLDKRKGWKGTKAIVIEEQINCMRGDDNVYFYHKNCFLKFIENKFNKLNGKCDE